MLTQERTASPALAASVMLISSLLLAAENDILLSDYQRSAALREEVAAAQPAWRAPEEDSQSWRSAPQERSGQARFGYDPGYDEMQSRLYASKDMQGATLHEPQPSTLLRVQF